MVMATRVAGKPRLADQIARHYGDVHPQILRHFLQWTLLMRESFDGDLDMMIVLAVISDRTLRDQNYRKSSFEDFLENRNPNPQVPLTNRKSIADSTGIPRETVRRKVAQLLVRGWVTEREDGSLLPSKGAAGVANQMQPIALRSFEILGQLGEVFIRLGEAEA
jgi:hypothetical protein